MKFLVVASVMIVCEAGRGSGPYLPSGWKPHGPAFYLPSEVSKPLNKPLKDVVFSESEASGSDFLREYGPPKYQEVSQDISLQGLPDVVNDKLFTETVVESNNVNENSKFVTEVTEEKGEVNIEVNSAAEVSAVTENPSVTEIKSITKVEKEADAVPELGYLVEPTVAIVVSTETVTAEANVQSGDQILEDIVTNAPELTTQQQVSDQFVKVEELAIIDTAQVTSGTEEPSVGDNKQTELDVESSDKSVTQQTDVNFDIVSNVETKVDKVEEVNIEKIVQNIPELIISLENEIKSQQAETIQEVPAVVQIVGSLEQTPEGFLEYGPPGFSEYGPPKEGLSDNTIEDKIADIQSIENSANRRRRFSPKFRFSPKSH